MFVFIEYPVFNIFIVDKYGQYTKVYEKKYGVVRLRSKVTDIKSLS